MTKTEMWRDWNYGHGPLTPLSPEQANRFMAEMKASKTILGQTAQPQTGDWLSGEQQDRES